MLVENGCCSDPFCGFFLWYRLGLKVLRELGWFPIIDPCLEKRLNTDQNFQCYMLVLKYLARLQRIRYKHGPILGILLWVPMILT